MSEKEEVREVHIDFCLEEELDKALVGTDRFLPEEHDSEDVMCEKAANEVKSAVTCVVTKDVLRVVSNFRGIHGVKVRERIIEEMENSKKEFVDILNDDSNELSNLAESLYNGVIEGIDKSLEEFKHLNERLKDEN